MQQRSLIAVDGEDRVDWLQGQSTNDLRELQAGDSISFCLCSPKGQIEAIVNALFRASDVLLTTDFACKQAVLDRIEHMVVMEDVAGREEAGLACLRVVGPEAAKVEGRIAVRGQGYTDVWVSPEEAASLQATIPTISASTYDIWRLEQGIPVWGQDVSGRTLPPELGPAFEQAHVSYTKGCYTGQEVLQRIYSRGHTNKTWVALTSERELGQGSLGQGVTVTSVVTSPHFGHLAGAVVRNELAEPSKKIEIGETVATVYHFPLER
jgi:folate-binding protein YgfZ